jgi:hypothetical protein
MRYRVICIESQAIRLIRITKEGCEKCRLKKLHFATSYPLFTAQVTSLSINSDYIASILGMTDELQIEMDVEGGECRLFHIRMGTEEIDEDRQ